MLIGFFDFYSGKKSKYDGSRGFDPEKEAISITHKKPIIFKQDNSDDETIPTYLSYIRQALGHDDLYDLIDQDQQKWHFTIVDPFDATYNPAKTLEIGSELTDQYIKSFEKMSEILRNNTDLRAVLKIQ